MMSNKIIQRIVFESILFLTIILNAEGSPLRSDNGESGLNGLIALGRPADGHLSCLLLVCYSVCCSV